LDHKLDLFYRRTTKQQPDELFRRKTTEASTLPEYGDVIKCLETIKSGLEENLRGLEAVFGESVGPVVEIRSEKSSGAQQKNVGLMELYARLILFANYFVFQTSRIWRHLTAGLAIQILWTSKQRSGIVVNLTLREWEDRNRHLASTVVTVSKHKTGDTEPGTIVLDEQMDCWMER